MGNYSLIREGDRLPTVGVLQKLLNARGASLNCDGIFGPRTRGALSEYQRQVRIPATGEVDQRTFASLFAPEGLRIADSIDVFDPEMMVDARMVQETGGGPLLLGGMSLGVLQAVVELRSQQNLFLLRFNGHGSPGMMGVALGKGDIDVPFSDMTLENSRDAARLGLQGIFGPYGSIQMLGCRVGLGSRGQHFLQNLAHGFGVPVTGALTYQSVGSPFTLSGNTFTGFPGGMTLKTWCEALPEFVGKSPQPA